MAALSGSEEIFSRLSSKFTQLLHVRTEGDRKFIEQSLDELNSLNYRYPIVKNNTKAVLLINQCCSLISPEDHDLVVKCSQLILCLVDQQKVAIEGRTLTLVINWCFEALNTTTKNVLVDVLAALNAVIRSSDKNFETLIPDVIKKDSPLVALAKPENAPEVILFALQCLEACTTIPTDHKQKDTSRNANYLAPCIEIFKCYLEKTPPNIDELIYCKILIICLHGLQNIILQDNELVKDELGVFLGYIKSFMVFGINGVEFLVPSKITPSALSIPEPTTNLTREKRGGKVTKHRKQRTKKGADSGRPKEWLDDEASNHYMPATTTLFNFNSDGNFNTFNGNTLKTSDSDFSDTEGGRSAKLSVTQGRVRQAALNLFSNTIKLVDKTVMFSYWSSFIPENSLCGKHNLMTSILKDPSARSRMAALNALLMLLSSSKFYLAQAESSGKNTSFTPFSVIIGFMVKELHRCLGLALTENSLPVLTQVLKCFAALVQATPYTRLTPGLLTNTIRRIKIFLYHRDTTVQVGALIVLGCILASEPVLPETRELLLRCPHSHPPKKEEEQNRGEHTTQGNTNHEDFDYVDFSSEDEDLNVTPDLSQMPWIVEKCLSNLGGTSNGENKVQENLVHAPVKLESLQVLSAMSRNYFESLMAPHIQQITRSLQLSLNDKNIDLKLHAGRAVDFIGQALNRCLSNEESKKLLSIEKSVVFWQTLLNEALPALIQNEQSANLRAVGCDCLGSIGPYVFGNLPRSTQILCITLLFAATRDEENSVKGAAIRALGIFVLYPSLREDMGFVVDTATSVHALMQDESLAVRQKASWALGNLSDALALKSIDKKSEEDFPLTLLLVLIHSSIKGCGENDKVKMHTVRGLGNIMQIIDVKYLTQSTLSKYFIEAVNKSIDVLVKCATSGSNMKVRWNACYALGNVLKNKALYHIVTWQEAVFKALMDLVVRFRNFKVRINAALALSCPSSRTMYKDHYHCVWKALLEAVEESQNMEDYTEYKHKDHLVEQICMSLAHLTTLLTKEDLPGLESCLASHSESFKVHMKKVYDRLLPEKATLLFTAANYVDTLSKETLRAEQNNTLAVLNMVFTQVLL